MRSARKRGWPDGLYERDGYFSWRNPLTRKEYGLGRDRLTAFREAIEANNHLAGTTATRRLVDRLIGGDDRTLAEWMRRYDEKLDARHAAGKLADNTRRTYRSLGKKLLAGLGPNTLVERVSTLMIADLIDGEIAAGRHRSAQALRSVAGEVFRSAMAAGWIAANPVTVTDKVQVKVQRARLTWEVFQAVYAAAGPLPWLQNAIALALVTGQRREDVALAKFADVHDGAWWCVQQKTGNRVFLPLDLRLDVFGKSLEDVVRQCRTTGVLSRHLVHQTRPWGNSPPGRAIWKDTISRRFSDMLSDLRLSFGDKSPPTFHEIRSLAERLYDAQGNVNTKDLLGHRDERSTAIYKDRRGAEWITVKVG
jgi:enterobacteria phage integrase